MTQFEGGSRSIREDGGTRRAPMRVPEADERVRLSQPRISQRVNVKQDPLAQLADVVGGAVDAANATARGLAKQSQLEAKEMERTDSIAVERNTATLRAAYSHLTPDQYPEDLNAFADELYASSQDSLLPVSTDPDGAGQRAMLYASLTNSRTDYIQSVAKYERETTTENAVASAQEYASILGLGDLWQAEGLLRESLVEQGIDSAFHDGMVSQMYEGIYNSRIRDLDESLDNLIVLASNPEIGYTPAIRSEYEAKLNELKVVSQMGSPSIRATASPKIKQHNDNLMTVEVGIANQRIQDRLVPVSGTNHLFTGMMAVNNNRNLYAEMVREGRIQQHEADRLHETDLRILSQVFENDLRDTEVSMREDGAWRVIGQAMGVDLSTSAARAAFYTQRAEGFIANTRDYLSEASINTLRDTVRRVVASLPDDSSKFSDLRIDPSSPKALRQVGALPFVLEADINRVADSIMLQPEKARIAQITHAVSVDGIYNRNNTLNLIARLSAGTNESSQALLEIITTEFGIAQIPGYEPPIDPTANAARRELISAVRSNFVDNRLLQDTIEEELRNRWSSGLDIGETFGGMDPGMKGVLAGIVVAHANAMNIPASQVGDSLDSITKKAMPTIMQVIEQNAVFTFKGTDAGDHRTVARSGGGSLINIDLKTANLVLTTNPNVQRWNNYGYGDPMASMHVHAGIFYMGLIQSGKWNEMSADQRRQVIDAFTDERGDGGLTIADLTAQNGIMDYTRFDREGRTIQIDISNWNDADFRQAYAISKMMMQDRTNVLGVTTNGDVQRLYDMTSAENFDPIFIAARKEVIPGSAIPTGAFEVMGEPSVVYHLLDGSTISEEEFDKRLAEMRPEEKKEVEKVYLPPAAADVGRRVSYMRQRQISQSYGSVPLVADNEEN